MIYVLLENNDLFYEILYNAIIMLLVAYPPWAARQIT